MLSTICFLVYPAGSSEAALLHTFITYATKVLSLSAQTFDYVYHEELFFPTRSVLG